MDGPFRTLVYVARDTRGLTCRKEYIVNCIPCLLRRPLAALEAPFTVARHGGTENESRNPAPQRAPGGHDSHFTKRALNIRPRPTEPPHCILTRAPRCGPSVLVKDEVLCDVLEVIQYAAKLLTPRHKRLQVRRPRLLPRHASANRSPRDLHCS